MTDFVLLASQTASNDATINVTGLSSVYQAFVFVWSGLQPVTNAVFFLMRTSTDGGTIYDAGASDYAHVSHRVQIATTATHDIGGDEADDRIELWDNAQFGNAANEFSAFEIMLFNPLGTNETKVVWEGVVVNSSTLGQAITGSGVRLSAANVDAIRFLFSSGNISVGTLKVYGIKAS